jgi:putative tryptophan/tyrosine transport system substrate-binding protein
MLALTLRVIFVAVSLPMLLTGAAQAQAKRAKIGFVSFQGQNLSAYAQYFREGMKALGYSEGVNYELEAHFTGGNHDKTKEIVAALVKRPVDVLVVGVTPVAHMAKAATQTIPVVMLVSDPLATGLVASLSRPGGNLTGVSMAGPDLAGKRLEILREIRPSVSTVAFVGSARDSNGRAFAREMTEAAGKLGMKMLVKFVDSPSDISDTLFDDLKREGAETVVVQPIFTSQREHVIALANKVRLPVISDYPPFAEAGALFTLGVDDTERYKRLAYFVDRILKGAKPADLPVEQPTTFKLVVNTRTAKALGWTMSDTFLHRADQVIE